MIDRFFSPYFYYLQNFLMSVKTDYSISVGDIIATLSILFAIYQFRKQMALSRREHVDSQKETWFLNVIVLPQLPEIKGFYKVLSLKSASNLNGNLNCSKELEHYAS